MPERMTYSPKTSAAVSLAGYYLIGIVATTIGAVLVLLINLFTPLEFFQNQLIQMSGAEGSLSGSLFVSHILPRMILMLLAVYGVVTLAINRLLAPITHYLRLLRNNVEPHPKLRRRACRRLISLPFLFVPVNVVLWVLVPVTLALSGFLTDHLDPHTALILAARASMIGLIASAIASHRIEAYSRWKLIPFFFPHGRLADISGTASPLLFRRIRWVNRLGNIVPLFILLITMVTLQWEVAAAGISAYDYGKEIIAFATVIFIYCFLATGILNHAVNRSIRLPVEEIMRALKRIRRGNFKKKVRVVSNDEIGQVGDAINDMIDGLQEREALRHSLELAREIQQSLLPTENPRVNGLDVAGASVYCDETGGDYYDFIEDRDRHSGRIRIAVGDVSGHGISSALLMATTRGFIRQRAALPGRTAAVIGDVNRQLSRDVAESGSFMTLFFLDLDLEARSLSWIRAGHDPALLYDPQTDCFEELKGEGIALGLDENFRFEENTRVGIHAGQIVVLYTDGVWEARNREGKIFGKNNLREVIRDHAASAAEKINAAVMSALAAFQEGQEPEDDITLIVIKIVL